MLAIYQIIMGGFLLYAVLMKTTGRITGALLFILPLLVFYVSAGNREIGLILFVLSAAIASGQFLQSILR
jgi:hypothetical protein